MRQLLATLSLLASGKFSFGSGERPNKEGVFDLKWLTREIFGFWGTFSAHFNLPAHQPWQQQIADGAEFLVLAFEVVNL
jgi:hypothetical protein